MTTGRRQLGDPQSIRELHEEYKAGWPSFSCRRCGGIRADHPRPAGHAFEPKPMPQDVD